MTIIVPIQGVHQDMTKHLEGCVYNPSSDLESQHTPSSLLIRYRFPQPIIDSNLSDVICIGSSPLLVTSKIPAVQNLTSFSITPISRTASSPC